jgi:hypothetical protein
MEDKIMAEKSFSARIGHIKRKLKHNERIEGKTLDLALKILKEKIDVSENDKFLSCISEKLKLGESLTEYEYHFFVEIILDIRKLYSE